MNRHAPLLCFALLLISCGSASSNENSIRFSVDPFSGYSYDSESTLPPTVDDFIPRYLNKINSYKTYKSVAKGVTKAKTALVYNEQSIDATLIKGEYSYMQSESKSDRMGTYHEGYFHLDKVAYRNDKNDFTVSTVDEYLSIYGVHPFDNSIQGYACDRDSIQKIEPIPYSDGYAFRLSFDPVRSTQNVVVQMKAIGSLDGYPTFSNIVIEIYVQEDLTPDHLEVITDYTSKKILDASCHQEFRVDYSCFDESIEIPNLEEIKAKYSL